MKEHQEHGFVAKHAAYMISGALLRCAIVLVVGIIPTAPLSTKIGISAVCAVVLYFLASRAVQAIKLTYFLSFALGVALAAFILQYIFWGWISVNAFTVPLFYVPLLCAGIASLVFHRVQANA